MSGLSRMFPHKLFISSELSCSAIYSVTLGLTASSTGKLLAGNRGGESLTGTYNYSKPCWRRFPSVRPLSCFETLCKPHPVNTAAGNTSERKAPILTDILSEETGLLSVCVRVFRQMHSRCVNNRCLKTTNWSLHASCKERPLSLAQGSSRCLIFSEENTFA